jgi:Mn2+/Fe2+ NRAMP family transporter
MLQRLSRWLRRWLWRAAAILAFILLFGWIFGGWSAGVNIVQWVAILGSGIFLVVLFWEGWVEWRERRRGRGSISPPDA